MSETNFKGTVPVSNSGSISNLSSWSSRNWDNDPATSKRRSNGATWSSTNWDSDVAHTNQFGSAGVLKDST